MSTKKISPANEGINILCKSIISQFRTNIEHTFYLLFKISNINCLILYFCIHAYFNIRFYVTGDSYRQYGSIACAGSDDSITSKDLCNNVADCRGGEDENIEWCKVSIDSRLM